MNFKIVFLILLGFLSVEAYYDISKKDDHLRDEFSFSSLKKDLKYKYYLLEQNKLNNANLEKAKKLPLNSQEQSRIQKMRKIFNEIKHSIIY